jgi:hypothetical protein
MSALGVITFGGAVYLLAILSVAQKNNRKVRFLMMWFAFAILPHAMITQKYMIEPRYLASALVPLSGLGGVGLATLLNAFNGWKLRYVMAAGLLLSTISLNAIVVRLMPYELDAKAIVRGASSILSRDRHAAILIPWSYTDYHFLRVMMPEAQLFNVDGSAHNSPSWRARMTEWYGESYIDDETTVTRLLKNRPVYYLGWRKSPTAQNIKNLADTVGFRKLSSFVDSLPLKDHLADNWLWKSSNLSFEYSGQAKQYQYFRVSMK